MMKLKTWGSRTDPNPWVYFESEKVIAVSPHGDEISYVYLEGGSSVTVEGTTDVVWEAIRMDQFNQARSRGL